MRIIRSVSDNQGALIRDILELHCGGAMDADVTYGAGALWKGLLAPQLKFDFEPRPPRVVPSLKFDIKLSGSGVIPADCQRLPLRPESLRSIMFDPPFLVRGAGPGNSIIASKRYGVFSSFKVMRYFFKDSLEEFFRVIRSRGVLVFKCQDFVDGRKNYFSHVEIYNLATEIGFKPKDLFILVAKTRPITRMVHQQHARKFHCYFWVFKKP